MFAKVILISLPSEVCLSVDCGPRVDALGVTGVMDREEGIAPPCAHCHHAVNATWSMSARLANRPLLEGGGVKLRRMA